MQDPKNRQNSPSGHHSTTLSGHIFAIKTRKFIDNRKKLVKQQYFLHMFSQLQIRWRVWGTPADFNGFRVLAALLHGTLAVGVITLGIGPHSSLGF